MLHTIVGFTQHKVFINFNYNYLLIFFNIHIYIFLNVNVAISQDDLIDINSSDPDIMLLRYGGFVNYDKDGRVIAVRAVSENRTQHVMMFGPPEFLRPEDVDR